MSFRLALRPEVLEDVADAARWYDEREAGLGARFVATVEERFRDVLRDPLSPRIRHRTRAIRWIYARPFPYRIIYKVSHKTVLVIAILHGARHEREWKDRF